MTTSELKIELIQQIIACDAIDLLLEIKKKLINSDINQVNEPATAYQKEEKVYFNEWQQERIKIALKQVENDECISDEEAEKEIQAWLQ